MPGPLPKRIEERRRRNAVPGETVVAMDGAVAIPKLPERGIDPVARLWFESLKDSGQSLFFEPSDWALAVVATRVLTKALRPESPASMMGQAWAMMDGLLTTERGRRKARLQVQRGIAEKPAEGPTAIDKYRARIGG